MVGEGGGVLEPDLVHLVRGGEKQNVPVHISCLELTATSPLHSKPATGVVRGCTHLGALEVGGELVHSYDLMSSIWHMSLSTGQVP